MAQAMKEGTKYDPAGKPVKKFGGNKAIHDGVRSGGEKYPKVGSMKMAKGQTG